MVTTAGPLMRTASATNERRAEEDTGEEAWGAA
jgi:hypothetical protein